MHEHLLMWLEAIITQEDLIEVTKEFLPVKIYLHHEGDEVKTDRWLLLQAPRLPPITRQ